MSDISISDYNEMEAVRPALDKTMPIDAYSLLTPASFLICVSTLRKEEIECVFLVFFSPGVLHSVAEKFESQLCSVVCLIPD